MFNAEGKYITDEGLELITARRNQKAELLREMREDRQSQALDRHSHVGAELGRLVLDPGMQYQLRTQLAGMSNELMRSGFTQGAAILASLARGLERAQYEVFGKPDGSEAIVEALASTGADLADVEAQLRAAMAPNVPDDISQPTAETTYPSEPRDISQSPEPVKVPDPSVPKMAPLGFGDAGPVEPLATFEDDDPDDMPAHDEPSLSPEPQDTPARRAAAQRRAEKRAAKGTDPKEGV